MQKRLSDGCKILFSDVSLNDDFPISHFGYTQKSSRSILHYHNSYEIGLCLEGSGTFFIENEAIAFYAGDISFIFPNQPHIARSPNEFPSRWDFIDVDFDRLFAGDSLFIDRIRELRQHIPYIVSPEHCTSLAPIVRMILEELEQRQNEYQLVAKDMLAIFINKLSRLCLDAGARRSLMPGMFTSISPALDHITQHYPQEIFIEDLAKKCGLSAPHFRLLFKRAMGVAPHRYLAQIRMKMAKTLLQLTNFPILSVALSVGYESISSFNRTFKEEFGQTPSMYRLHSQKEPNMTMEA
ncbi:MAG: AraC family transcriptional regulator [Oscillospiraceae bacterium]|nr:AraC family transcriptional regulator [Oscillospiraceae bacterium]